MQEQFLKVWDLDVNYKHFQKENNKETILILHWWWGKSNSWLHVWELLSEKWFNIIIPDLPWFWKTEITKVYTLEDYAECIEEFCKKLNLGEIILWWHSNWWAISITLENKKALKIEKLILNNSAGIRHDAKRTVKRKILNALAKKLKFLKKIKILQKLRNLFYRAIWSQDYLEAEKNPFLKQTYLNMISVDLQEKIKKIETVTLLIWGEKDTYTPLKDANIMKNTIKKSKLIVLENETHGIHLKNPKRLVDTFVNNI